MNERTEMTRPLRILHVIPSVSASRGGPSSVLRTLALWQVQFGCEVTVATTDDDGSERHELQGCHSTSGITYWFFPRQVCFYSLSMPLMWWVRKNVRNYDLVHIHGLFSFPAAAAAVCALLGRVPYVIRPYGVLNTWCMENRRPLLKKLSFWCVERCLLKRAALVQYASEHERVQAFRLQVDHQSVVIPNPVDVGGGNRVTAVVGDERYILFLGRLDRVKGLDLVLPAFARVRNLFPQLNLLIAGSGEPAFVSELKALAKELGVDSAVHWAGFLEGKAKSDAIAKAILFVLPSYSENFGVSVVEALAAGIPVVISDQIGIHQEVAEARAGLICACSVDSLTTAMATALADVGLRMSMAENGRQLADQYSPPCVTRRLIDAYEEIVAANDNRPHQRATGTYNC